MPEVTIVGSGASAVHFALSVLQKGYAVTMLDVGYDKPETVNPEDTLNGLKENLADPVEYFLGKKFAALIMPDAEKEYYGIPPSKEYVFRAPEHFRERSTGFEPLFSFARGGLAEAWTGGAYAYNDEELSDFPFRYGDIEPFYNEIAKRIGILGAKDDLSRFHPWHENLLPPLEFDEHAALLYAGYEKKKALLQKKYSCYLGRSRLAVLSRDHDGRQACDYTGRCMWGCPSDSLYVPSLTLKTCMTFPAFTYIPDMLVTHFRYGAANRVETVVAYDLVQKRSREFPVQRLVLAAGTLGTAKIFLNSIQQRTGQTPALQGLMDNRQILIPFINLHLAGKSFQPETYQYHQLAMGIAAAEPKKFVHGQITTLKTALMHPIIESIPLDLKTSIFLGRNLHAALGVANINFHDDRRRGNTVTLAGDPDPLRVRPAHPLFPARRREQEPEKPDRPGQAHIAETGGGRAAGHAACPAHGRQRALCRHHPHVRGAAFLDRLGRLPQPRFSQPALRRRHLLPVPARQEPDLHPDGQCRPRGRIGILKRISAPAENGF